MEEWWGWKGGSGATSTSNKEGDGGDGGRGGDGGAGGCGGGGGALLFSFMESTQRQWFARVKSILPPVKGGRGVSSI